MTRPNRETLAQAAADLVYLADRHHHRADPRNETGFDDLAELLGWGRWLDETTEAARIAAAYGPGVDGGVHTLHRGGEVADLDARTRDLLHKELRKLGASYRNQLGRLADRIRDDAEKIVGSAGLRAG